MADTFALKKGCILTVKYNGVVGENANPGETAWNSFAYQYTAEVNGNEKTLRAEPPKVGVKTVSYTHLFFYLGRSCSNITIYSKQRFQERSGLGKLLIRG